MAKRKKVPAPEVVEFPTQVVLSEAEFVSAQVDYKIEEKGVFFEDGDQFHLVIMLSKKEVKEEVS